MDASRRVVVTGLGVVAAPGTNSAAFWESLCTGTPAIGPIPDVDTSLLRFDRGAVIADYHPEDHFDRRMRDVSDRFSQYALLAAGEALDQAQIDWTPALKARTAVITGSGGGGQYIQDAGYEKLYARQSTRVHPLTVPRTMHNAGASLIAIEHGFQGPAFTISSACASAAHAIGQAFWMVRHGQADVAVTGGSEAPFAPGNLVAWSAMRVVAQDTCRPFSKDRSGLILGEGGAMLVLERLDRALARGAPILAEVAGFGMNADAFHLTQPQADGAARAMRLALDDAGLDPDAVGYINAHGTGTPANDPMETQAIRQVFGAHADRLCVSSTKSMHGHALGASGALEAVATVLALRHGLLPPTANFTEPDPDCDLDVIPNEARPADVEAALSNSFAFGGLNAVLAFRTWRGAG